MTQPPKFFIPGVTDIELEEVYAMMAKVAGGPAPEPGRRIYAITFQHDRVRWIARVGEQLSGIETVVKTAKRKRTERTMHHSDGATVTAIFPGHPWIVWTNSVRTQWVNPFMAGEPTSVTYFAGSN